jgi:hypothetical protein
MSQARPWSLQRLIRPAGPVTREGLRRRRTRTLVAMAVATAAGVGLSLWGTSIVRGSTAGEYVEPSVGPDEPGYQAYVVATPTLAVLVPGDDGDLVAAALLSLRPGDDGGAVTVVPTAALVPEATGDDASSGDTSSGEGDAGSSGSSGATASTEARSAGRGSGDASDDAGRSEATTPDVAGATVAEAYGDGGVDAAVEAMGQVVGAAVDQGVEVDADAWAELVEPSGPVTVSLTDPVGVWPAGEVTLPPAELGAFVAYAGPDEDEQGRAARQAAFWSAWLGRVAAAGEGGLPDDTDGDLARFVTGIARDPAAEVLPVVESDAGGGTLEPDPSLASELIAAAVPYPLSPAPGVRVRVRLLNGTDDPGLTAEVVPQLVAAGAEVTIAGNAGSFDVTETTYTYDDPDNRDDAQRIADALGVGRVAKGEQVSVTSEDQGTATTLSSADDPEAEIDMTIVLGSDAQDLIRRLESAG